MKTRFDLRAFHCPSRSSLPRPHTTRRKMAIFHSCVVAISIFCLAEWVSSEPFQADRYTINLDLPPKERWLNVTKKYAKYVPAIRKDLQNKIPEFVRPFAEEFALYLDKHFSQPFPDEMRGVAKGLNMTLAEIVLLNIFYDLSAYCTGIVVQQTGEGGILHGRNLDYDFSDTLRNTTFIVDYTSKGKVLYSGVTFAGLVGLMTAQRPHAVTVNLDERDRGFIWDNIVQALNKNVTPISFLIRDVVSKEGIDFNQTLKILSSTPIIADAYFIVGGVKPNEGAVITRARDSTVDVWLLDFSQSRWFLVETNYDHWTTPPPGDDRRDPAVKALKKLGQKKVNPSSLFQVLSTNPTLNNKTVYTTIMAAGDPDLLNTWIQRP